MGLAVRIIPLLLHSHGNLVKGTRFASWRTVGHAMQAARIHQARGVDELLFLDVAATPEKTPIDCTMVEQLTAGCFMPITAGGGVLSVDDVQALLRAGADKVAIGAAIHSHPGLIRECAEKVGSQAIVAVVETEHGRVHAAGKEWFGLSPVDQAITLERAGAGEILLMARDRDGTLDGYDLPTIHDVARAISIPVIAAGGCGSYEHMQEALGVGASAVATGAMLLWTDQTTRGAAEYLCMKGFDVRL